MDEVKKFVDEVQPAVETAKDVEIIYSEDGIVKVTLEAPLFLSHKSAKPYNEFPNGLEVVFYSDKQRPTGNLRADYGIQREKEKNVTVSGNVVWTSATKDERLETDELIWDEKNGKIHSDKFVKIITPTEVLYGMGMEANQDFSRYKIKEVHGSATVDPSQME